MIHKSFLSFFKTSKLNNFKVGEKKMNLMGLVELSTQMEIFILANEIKVKAKEKEHTITVLEALLQEYVLLL